MTYKLMVKTHLVTGLKYLCVTVRDDYQEYSGSGREWKKHLKENGNYITTKLLFESDNKEEFSKVCVQKSIEYDVVNSTEWANKVLERGGGEYLVDENGKRITLTFDSGLSEEELLEFCRTSNWFECSICGARMTENAFVYHRKCKKSPEFKMMPFHPEQFH
jgi:hypothetical protein